MSGKLTKADPCPFCNSDVIESRDFRVHCEGCGAFGPYRFTAEEAVLAWNERPGRAGSNPLKDEEG